MENKKTQRRAAGIGLGEAVRRGIERRREDTSALFYDVTVVLVAFLFSRCHIAFGAYPLSIAFVAVLPHGVWLAALGAVIGSLTVGNVGMIHAIICVIVVFLRIIISGSDRRGGELFSEPLVLRICAATVGAFVGSVYEVLIGGFAAGPLLYACVSILMSAALTFAFSGVVDSGISYSDLVFGKRNVLRPGRGEREKYNVYLFQGTFLLIVFLVSLSLRSYNILGISPAYIFSTFITLFAARRFGAMRAMTVGFVSSLGVSSLYSVAFALVGLGAGIIFEAGMIYALAVGGILLSAWSAYAGGSLGFLTTFPEYAVGAMLSAPLLRRLESVPRDGSAVASADKPAQDMVSATALAYKSALTTGSVDSALGFSAKALRRLCADEGALTMDEYRDTVIDAVMRFCRDCPCYNGCIEENPAPCIENIDAISIKLYKRETLFPDDSAIVPRYCHNSAALFDKLCEACAIREKEKNKSRRIEAIADEYDLIARLISEVDKYRERERCQDTALGDRLCEVAEGVGLHGCAVRVFGDRKKHFIIAGEDSDGSIVTSPELHKGIEEAAAVKLGAPEYYRRGNIALMECGAAPMLAVDFATVGKKAGTEPVSGDTATSFEDGDGRFYSLIADGMGRGERAHNASLLVAELLSGILSTPCSKSTAFHIVNHVIKSRSDECSSSVDLFDLDLMTGEAVFFKCGAAPSYVKRDSSIFRIKSETAPLGLMKSIDAERIRVEIRGGDYVIMLSDGVSQSTEESAWLVELLAREPLPDVREYAELILKEAEKRVIGNDDMTVSVARIIKL